MRARTSPSHVSFSLWPAEGPCIRPRFGSRKLIAFSRVYGLSSGPSGLTRFSTPMGNIGFRHDNRPLISRLALPGDQPGREPPPARGLPPRTASGGLESYHLECYKGLVGDQRPPD